ncbi:MAG TPA: response regulator transcription factor [Thermoleophilaceae bacterium]|jgi:DNA-binding NarL/FixJ family response regulator|nr:response regulator transcription factor [Thermoleophilaceae bacterium]
MHSYSHGLGPTHAGCVLIVDDDDGARAALVDALGRLGRPFVQVKTGEDALQAAELERPAVVISEVLLPATSGYEVCIALKERYGRDFPVIFVSGQRTHVADRVAGLLIGADDYLVKPVHPDELLVRVQRLLLRSDSAPAPRSRLTPREAEVLGLLIDGLHQAEIAEQLVITPRTVGKHVEHILAKFGVQTRAQAIAFALRGATPVRPDAHAVTNDRTPKRPS